MRTLSCFYFVIVALLLSGCMSTRLINDAAREETVYYRVLNYDSAFLTDQALVLNYSVRRYKNGVKKSVDVHAFYPFDSNSSSPQTEPSTVMKGTYKPKEGVPIKIITVIVKGEPFNTKMAYDMIDTHPDFPAIIVSARDPEKPIHTIDSAGVNTHYSMYLNEPSGGNNERIILTMQSYEFRKSNYYKVLALPMTLIIDVVTLPIQILFSQGWNTE